MKLQDVAQSSLTESEQLLLAAQTQMETAKQRERAISARNKQASAALKDMTQRIGAGQRAYELLSQALSNAQQQQKRVTEAGNAEQSRLRRLKTECESISSQASRCTQELAEQQIALKATNRAAEVESAALEAHKERLSASRVEWQDLEQRKAECKSDVKELRETAQVRRQRLHQAILVTCCLDCTRVISVS